MLDEEQVFSILHVIIKHGIDKITLGWNFPKEIKDILGKGDWIIINKMSDTGLLFHDPSDSSFSITKAGENKYKYLRRKRRYQSIKEWGGWLTLLAAVVGAVYAALTYYAGGDTKSQPPPKPALMKVQPPKAQNKPLATDTTKDRRPYSLKTKK